MTFAQIRDYLASRGSAPRILLFYGSQSNEGLGDIFVGSRHYWCLRQIFTNVEFMVHTQQDAGWRAACSDEIQCIAQLPRELIVSGLDLIIFDTGRFTAIQPWVEESQAVVLDIPALGDFFRYRYPGTDWHEIPLPPQINRPRRIFEVYEALGFPVQRHILVCERKRKTSGIFVNPYASFGLKSLPASFLSELFEVLPQKCGSQTITCPPVPPHPPKDAAVYEELHNIVVAAQHRGHVQVRPLQQREYVELIKSANLVIGPDTSSQHIAANYGTPSIACFVPEAGYRYIFWASLGAGNICVRVPRREASSEVRSVAELVTMLASRLLILHWNDRQPPSHPAVVAYLDICRQVARRELTFREGTIAIESVKQNVRALVPAKWQRFVVPELTRISRGILHRSAANLATIDARGLAELQDVNAAQVLALLSAVHSS